ncbi:hypothetical protein CSPX01_13849 [Colletotrichum filicis]|nr:hypothetical protein CSPX01_13849 [Colletotrichum filicis]
MTRPLSTWRVAPLRVCASFNEIGLNSADLNKTCLTELGRQWASAERPCQACLFPWATSVCGRALERGGERSRGPRIFIPFCLLCISQRGTVADQMGAVRKRLERQLLLKILISSSIDF